MRSLEKKHALDTFCKALSGRYNPLTSLRIVGIKHGQQRSSDDLS
jgi:hypothetical protein